MLHVYPRNIETNKFPLQVYVEQGTTETTHH